LKMGTFPRVIALELVVVAGGATDAVDPTRAVVDTGGAVTVLPGPVVVVEEMLVLVATLLPLALGLILLVKLADVLLDVTVAPSPVPGVTLPANRAALWNLTHPELAGTRAVYGILVISPKLSGGCVYVCTFPCASL